MTTFTIKLENGYIIPRFDGALVVNANTAAERHIQPQDRDTAAAAFYQSHGSSIAIQSIEHN